MNQNILKLDYTISRDHIEQFTFHACKNFKYFDVFSPDLDLDFCNITKFVEKPFTITLIFTKQPYYKCKLKNTCIFYIDPYISNRTLTTLTAGIF